MLRCWLSGRGSSTASSTANDSFCSRRCWWWGRAWPRGSWASSDYLRVSSSRSQARALHRANNSHLASPLDIALYQAAPPPRPVISVQWEGLSTPNFLEGGPWGTRTWWELYKGSLGPQWIHLDNTVCFSSLKVNSLHIIWLLLDHIELCKMFSKMVPCS